MVMPVRDSSLVLELNGACGKNSPATSKWKDLSGHGNDGALSGFGYVAGSGWSGDGLEFDGVDDFVSFPSSANYANITVEIALKVTASILSSGYHVVIDKSGSWYLFTKDGFPKFFINSDSIYALSPTALVAENIYSLLGSYDGHNVCLYVNGVLKQTTPSIVTLSASIDKMAIMKRMSTSVYISSSTVLLTRIYNRALTPAEVLQNYQAGYAYTPQIGARESISITKPLTSSASRIGAGTRTAINSVKPIATDLSRVGMGNREAISTVEPITSSLSRIGIGSREIITRISPITTGISKLLPPIKCNLSLIERLGNLSTKERIGAINTTERLAKIEVM